MRLKRFTVDPTIGQINGSFRAHAPAIDDPEFGRSRSIVPLIQQIRLDDTPRIGPKMGLYAEKIFFAGYPDFVFNVCFAVGNFSLFGTGLYADPHSIWFNVFFGYYQLDVPKSLWSRPFGYSNSSFLSGDIVFEDVARLGKADWNYFSNYMYGVPLDCILPFNDVNMKTISCTKHPRQQIGARFWDHIELNNVVVASGYQSNRERERRLVNNSIITPIWRRTFGLPHPRPDFPESFVSTNMRAKIYLSFWEDDDFYRTMIIGGTANNSFGQDKNEKFLKAQLKSCHEIIVNHFPTLGFNNP